jgi:hypothetical protein
LCAECGAAPNRQRAGLVLLQRRAEAQRQRAQVAALCMSCSGLRDASAATGAGACDSLDCPILFERHRVAQEAAHAEAVCDALLESW